MSPRLVACALAGLLRLGSGGGAMLFVLAACAAVAPPAAPAAAATVAPPATAAAPAPATHPASVTSPASATPATATTPATSATPARQEPAPPPAPTRAQAAADEKMLPPCVPVRRRHIKRHKRKTAQAPQMAAPAGPPQPPADTVVDAQVGEESTPLSSILGEEVESPTGEKLGRVVDVLADARGHVRVAIIDFGGFLGVGTRRIAVDWPLLHFDAASHDKPLILAVDRKQLQSAPEYNPTKPRVLMPPAAPDAADASPTEK